MKTNPAIRYRSVSLPNAMESLIGTSFMAGIGKNNKTPIKLKRKWAMAMLMALLLEFTIAAMNAVIVVPIFAPIINGAAIRIFTIFFATMGTTIEVVMVLERIAAVVMSPQKKDFISPAKKNLLNVSGDCDFRKFEMSLLKIRIEITRKINDSITSTTPFEIFATIKSVAKLNGVHAEPNARLVDPSAIEKNVSPSHADAVERNP